MGYYFLDTQYTIPLPPKMSIFFLNKITPTMNCSFIYIFNSYFIVSMDAKIQMHLKANCFKKTWKKLNKCLQKLKPILLLDTLTLNVYMF